MGFILEQTPEMGEYSGEVRRTVEGYADSFWLRGEGSIEILMEDIPKIRAVLDAVEAHAMARR